MLLKPGSTWKSRYEILQLVGEGGFASVYRARDLELNRDVAIKVLKTNATSGEELTRFRREAHLLAKLSHKNIVSVYSYDVIADQAPCITMEFMQGESLEKKVNRDGPLDAQSCLKIFSEIADALSYAHSLGIVHRDLSPANIFLEQKADGVTAKIIDFGLSSIITGENATLSIDKLTATGLLVGNPAFMSPEQTRGEKLDARSDIYSLGCTMYKVASGEPAFDSSSSTGYLFLHQNEYPKAPPIAWTDPKLVERVENVLLKCMQKDPEKRFQNADQFKAALNCSDSNLQIAAKDLSAWSDRAKPSTASKLRRGLPAIAALLFVAFVITQFTLFENLFARIITSLPLGKITIGFEDWIADHTKDTSTRIVVLSSMVTKVDADRLPGLELDLATQYFDSGKQTAAISHIKKSLEALDKSKLNKTAKLVQIERAVALTQRCSVASLQNDVLSILARCLQESLDAHARPAKSRQILLMIAEMADDERRIRYGSDNLTQAASAISRLFKQGRVYLSERERQKLFNLAALLSWKEALDFFETALTNSGTTPEMKDALRYHIIVVRCHLTPKEINYHYVKSSSINHSYAMYGNACVEEAFDDGIKADYQEILDNAANGTIPISENSKMITLLALGRKQEAIRIARGLAEFVSAETSNLEYAKAPEQQANFQQALCASNYFDDDELACSILRRYEIYLPAVTKRFEYANFKGTNHQRFAELIVDFRSNKRLTAAYSLAKACVGEYRRDIEKAAYYSRIYALLDAKAYELAEKFFAAMKKDLPEDVPSWVIPDKHLESLIQCGLGNVDKAWKLHESIYQEYKTGNEFLSRSELNQALYRRVTEMVEVAIDSNHEEIASRCLEQMLTDEDCPAAKRFVSVLAPELPQVKTNELRQLFKYMIKHTGLKPEGLQHRFIYNRLAFTRVRH